VKDTIRARCVGIEINPDGQNDFKITLESQSINIDKLDEWKQTLAKWVDIEVRY